ncbi:MAG TPA: DUF5668 domain-containing protein [Bryobacteraceae bacterium]|nr:DUF5668 domain-containing protein [Bryobacteraceae bacterium]
MNDQSHLLLRAIKGPVIMITIGVLFAADHFTDYRFSQTWPILLIVIGILQFVAGRGRRADYYPPPPSTWQQTHPGYQQPRPAPPPSPSTTDAAGPDGRESRS